MKLKLILTITAITLSSFGQSKEEVDAANDIERAMREVKVKNLNVSLVSLIATPERYDGEMIQVKGYLHLELNSNAIYIHEDDSKNKITANAFWVNFSEKFEKKKNPLDYNDKYIILIGRFDAGDKGSAALFSGAIKNIIRLD
jgi:hypothetical protein